MHNYTVVENQDEKLDIMEHVNQEHVDEMIMLAQHYRPDLEMTHVQIADIFVEGVLLSIQTNNANQNIFIEFELEGDLEEQILYLAYIAMTKQGKDLEGNKKQYFEVVDKVQVSKNIIRLTLQTQTPLPAYYAGYAYGMVLKSIKKIPKNSQQPKEPKQGFVKKLGNQAMLWGMKKVSKERRQKIMEGMNKDVRFYTLRCAWQAEDATFVNQGYMDVFTHDNTAGSEWAESLAVGDIIFSRIETADKHSHLANGKMVLIADEAAYPALAGILDFWQNSVTPEVIILSQQQAEQDYFKDSDFPTDASVHCIVGEYEKQGEAIISLLDKIEDIDGAWGAFEHSSAKKVRYYLRNQKKLDGKANHIKAYWRVK